jgi:hypothetical protein
VWSKHEGADVAFEKAFTAAELKCLVRAFRVGSGEIKGKKKVLVGLLFGHLHTGENFAQQTYQKGCLFETP